MKMRELLSDETKWTRRKYAEDRWMNSVRPCEHEAVAWCLKGAALKCYTNDEEYRKVMDALTFEVGGRISAWNDSPERTFAEVKALLERLDI